MQPFVDTNVLVYAHDTDEPDKQARALAVLAEHADTLTLSAQVLAEFYVTVTRRLVRPLDPADAAAQVDELARTRVVGVDGELVSAAIALSRDAQLSLWDAMVLAAARRGACDVVLTEDLQHGAVLGGIEVRNPFVEG